jgi:hypothetical protein
MTCESRPAASSTTCRSPRSTSRTTKTSGSTTACASSAPRSDAGPRATVALATPPVRPWHRKGRRTTLPTNAPVHLILASWGARGPRHGGLGAHVRQVVAFEIVDEAHQPLAEGRQFEPELAPHGQVCLGVIADGCGSPGVAVLPRVSGRSVPVGHPARLGRVRLGPGGGGVAVSPCALSARWQRVKALVARCCRRWWGLRVGAEVKSRPGGPASGPMIAVSEPSAPDSGAARSRTAIMNHAEDGPSISSPPDDPAQGHAHSEQRSLHSRADLRVYRRVINDHPGPRASHHPQRQAPSASAFAAVLLRPLRAGLVGHRVTVARPGRAAAADRGRPAGPWR